MSIQTVNISKKVGFALGTACAGPDGCFYYIMIQHDKNENKRDRSDKTTPIEVILYLADLKGNIKVEKKLDTSKEDGGLNYWSLGESCMMAFSASMNTLALHISRTMTVSDDGLNHQGAVMFMYESNTLEWVKDENYIQG
jgi:hypothetical protein